MTEIKLSLEKIRAASKMLQESDYSGPYDEEKIQTLRDTLFEINESVEQLKDDVSDVKDSPIRVNK